jgi:hypothetical protein
MPADALTPRSGPIPVPAGKHSARQRQLTLAAQAVLPTRPATVPDFVGRDRELRRLQSWVSGCPRQLRRVGVCCRPTEWSGQDRAGGGREFGREFGRCRQRTSVPGTPVPQTAAASVPGALAGLPKTCPPAGEVMADLHLPMLTVDGGDPSP